MRILGFGTVLKQHYQGYVILMVAEGCIFKGEAGVIGKCVLEESTVKDLYWVVMVVLSL